MRVRRLGVKWDWQHGLAGLQTTRSATHSKTAPLVWRAPEGPEDAGGLRDRPLRAAGSRVAISRAAGPDGARNTSGAASNKLNREFRLRRPWAAAGPGRTTSRRTEPHISNQAPPVWRAPEGPEGTGGPRDRPLRAAGSRVAISRAGRRPPAHTAAGPQSSTTERPEHQRCHTATTCSANGERAGRRPRAHQAARPDESGPTAPGTPAAGQTALTLRRRRAPGVPCS